MRQNQLLKIFISKITKITYTIITVPYFLLGWVILITNKNFKNDYFKIIKEIDKNNSYLDNIYLNCLIMAEDHRYKIHKGIDFISILRAVKSTFINKKFQGASTIEQQLVRVVTFRYERTIKRKFREQLLSVLISRSRSKICIANTYLSIGYFGYNLKGYKSAINTRVNFNEIEKYIVSHLKYPLPKNNNDEWEKKINNRVAYISTRTEKHSVYLFLKEH